MSQELKIGDYVLATKYSDGDPADAWAVGYYSGELADPRCRYQVINSEGKQFRANGFRRCEKISDKVGQFLVTNSEALEKIAHSTIPEVFNLWMIANNQEDYEEINQ